MNRTLTLILLTSLALHGISRAAERPNIIVVLCDDLGYADLECYGHPHVKTPNLNGLAADGIRFTDCYSAAPVCSPSRAGLLSGRSPNRLGIYDWIDLNRDPQVHLRQTPTIPHLLQQAGYETCMLGKWHLSGRFNHVSQPTPDRFGFDYWFATERDAIPTHHNPTNFVRNGKRVGKLNGYSCQLVVDEAISWLSEKRESRDGKPFFMYMALHETHTPIASPADLVEQYTPVARNAREATYFANVANVDKAIGRLMAALNLLGLHDNTLLVFTSDNGPETLNRHPKAHSSYGRATPLKGRKLWTREGGFRVPCIMRWPGGIQAGQVQQAPVSSLDFLPTFCDLAEADRPADLPLDGTSIAPLFKNDAMVRSRPLLWVYYRALNKHRVAMRDGDWKILADLDIPVFEKSSFLTKNIHTKNADTVKAAGLIDFQIYNVRDDAPEDLELSTRAPEKADELKRKLLRQYRELVDDSYVWPVEEASSK